MPSPSTFRPSRRTYSRTPAPAPPPCAGLPSAGIPKILEAVTTPPLKAAQCVVRLVAPTTRDDLELLSSLLATSKLKWDDTFEVSYTE